MVPPYGRITAHYLLSGEQLLPFWFGKIKLFGNLANQAFFLPASVTICRLSAGTRFRVKLISKALDRSPATIVGGVDVDHVKIPKGLGLFQDALHGLSADKWMVILDMYNLGMIDHD
jgi:hypothetical protein